MTAAFALAACLFTTGCDDTTRDDALAEMIEICEDLDGDCDEEIEDFLAAQEEAQEPSASTASPTDGPNSLTSKRRCSHCGDGRIDDLTQDGAAEPLDAAQEVDRLAARPPLKCGTPTGDGAVDALDNGVDPTHDIDVTDGLAFDGA